MMQVKIIFIFTLILNTFAYSTECNTLIDRLTIKKLILNKKQASEVQLAFSHLNINERNSVKAFFDLLTKEKKNEVIAESNLSKIRVRIKRRLITIEKKRKMLFDPTTKVIRKIVELKADPKELLQMYIEGKTLDLTERRALFTMLTNSWWFNFEVNSLKKFNIFNKIRPTNAIHFILKKSKLIDQQISIISNFISFRDNGLYEKTRVPFRFAEQITTLISENKSKQELINSLEILRTNKMSQKVYSNDIKRNHIEHQVQMLSALLYSLKEMDIKQSYPLKLSFLNNFTYNLFPHLTINIESFAMLIGSIYIFDYIYQELLEDLLFDKATLESMKNEESKISFRPTNKDISTSNIIITDDKEIKLRDLEFRLINEDITKEDFLIQLNQIDSSYKGP